MQYISTRGESPSISDAELLFHSLAPDGGLYVPAFFPKCSQDFWEQLKPLSFAKRCAYIANLFLPSISLRDMQKICERAFSPLYYQKGEVLRVHCLDPYIGSQYLAETSQGASGSIKDIAQTFQASLLAYAIEKNPELEELYILNASSGNAGIATLSAFKGYAKLHPLVLFPEQVLNDVQRHILSEVMDTSHIALQMNLRFEQVQSLLNHVMQSPRLKESLAQRKTAILSTNAYNWLNVLPHLMLLISSYVDMMKCEDERIQELQRRKKHQEENYLLADDEDNLEDTEQDKKFTSSSGQNKEKGFKANETSNAFNSQDFKFNVALPDGHLAELLAAYYAKRMGVPISRIICASNKNKTLADFFRTGEFKLKPEALDTNTPACNILYAINMERLLFDVCPRKENILQECMQNLRAKGSFILPPPALKQLQKYIVGGFSDSLSVTQCISSVYDESDYCVDPHTALCINVYKRYAQRAGDALPVLYLSVASPYIYAENVAEALFYIKKGKPIDHVSYIEALARETDMPAPFALASYLQAYEKEKKDRENEWTSNKGKMKTQVEDYTDFEQENIFDPLHHVAWNEMNPEHLRLCDLQLKKYSEKELLSFLWSYFGLKEEGL